MPAVLGRIFFAWVDAGEVFDPLVHAREDEHALDADVVIEQLEGDFATCDIEIVAPAGGLLATGRKTRAFVSVEVDGVPTLLFAGRVVGMPLAIAGQAAAIQLLGKPSDWQALQKATLDQVKAGPAWDPAFTHPDDRDAPDRVLAATPHLLHWSRTTGACTLSHIAVGASAIDLRGRWFEPSRLQLEVAAPPLARVDLVVEAQWEQFGAGVLDLTDDLRAAFGPRVSTLTPEAWEASWAQTTGLGAAGVSLAEAKMERVELRDSLGFAVKVSDVQTLDPVIDEDPDQDWEVSFREVVYDATLSYDVDYRQKRRETITAGVDLGLQGLLADEAETETVLLRAEDIDGELGEFLTYHVAGVDLGLQGLLADEAETETVLLRAEDIDNELGEFLTYHVGGDGIEFRQKCRPAAGWLFSPSTGELSARGAQAVAHAYRRALALGLRRARAVELTVECPSADVLDISCDHSVRIEHPLFPAGELTGKVVGYRLRLGAENVAEITLGVCVGAGGPGSAPAAGDAVQVDLGTVAGTRVALGAASPQKTVPQPIDASRVTSPAYMVQLLQVLNEGSSQGAGVWTGETPAKWLKLHPTVLQLQLRSLDAVDELAVEAAMPDAATPMPLGVNLTAEGA